MNITAAHVLIGERFVSDVGVAIGPDGRISAITPAREATVDLGKCVLLPGAVNAHSHAFQRLLRGRTQVASASDDNFWSWRDVMYRVAGMLDVDGLRIATRQAFLEMVLSGITSVGEFHYVHHAADGAPHPDPIAMSRAVIEAAQDVGIRLTLIRTIYLRGDFATPPSALQKRFCDPTVGEAFAAIDALVALESPTVGVAVAAHSVRAMAIDDIVEAKVRYNGRPFHIHVSEQRREVEQCLKHTGVAPVTLLSRAGVLDRHTTLVHATHLKAGEAGAIAASRAGVCICPSTEADLGDGLGPVAELFAARVPMSLGSDGQTLLSLTEEARRLEMHARLQHEKRNVLADRGEAVARACFDAMTVNGARALGTDSGSIAAGKLADLVSYDLADPALAGADDASMLAAIVFSADSRAVKDVFVHGQGLVRDRRHAKTSDITAAYGDLSKRLFPN